MLQETPNPTKYLVKALKKILRPLVNLLIYKGITYPVLNEIVKELFVEIAETEFKLKDKKQTDSRINFLTGIHRKDVKRLRNSQIDTEEPLASSLSALLISRWLGDVNYSDDSGNPLPLAKLIKRGGNKSFEKLVTSISKDIRSRAILDEWLNMGIVYLDKNGLVCLNKTAYIPQQSDKEKIWFFANNCHDHLAAAINNIKAESPVFLERAVYYDQLSLESITELTELSKTLGMETLLKINSHALTLQNNDKYEKNAINRMRLGLYFYHTDDQSSNIKTEE